MTTGAPCHVRILSANLGLIHAVAFNAQTVHRESVSRRDATAGTVHRHLVTGTSMKGIMATCAHGLCRASVRHTWISAFGEAVDDLRLMALQARRRAFPGFSGTWPFVATDARRIVSEHRDVLFVLEGVRTSVHVCVADSARCPSVKAQIAMMASATRRLAPETPLVSIVVEDHRRPTPVTVDQQTRGESLRDLVGSLGDPQQNQSRARLPVVRDAERGDGPSRPHRHLAG
jgi:hypothetical protein